MYGQARSVRAPAPPGRLIIRTLSERSETEVAVMISPPSALPRCPWQVADSGASRYAADPGRNSVPNTCAVPGSGTDAGRFSRPGAGRGEYGVPVYSPAGTGHEAT